MLADLPPEVLLRILSYVEVGQLVDGLATCCRRFYWLAHDRQLWLQTLGTGYFRHLGIDRRGIDDITCIRSWFINLLKDYERLHFLFDSFTANNNVAIARQICSYRLYALAMLAKIRDYPGSIRNWFWANWLIKAIHRLEGLHLIFELGVVDSTQLTDPLDYCVAAAYLDGTNIYGKIIRALDDTEWIEDLKNASPLHTLDCIIARIDSFGFDSLILKNALFCRIAGQNHLLQTSILSFADPRSSTYSCVYLGADSVCFVDFTQNNAKIRSVQDIRDRIEFLGSPPLQDGVKLSDILPWPAAQDDATDNVSLVLYALALAVPFHDSRTVPDLFACLCSEVLARYHISSNWDTSVIEQEQELQSAGTIMQLHDEYCVVLKKLPRDNCILVCRRTGLARAPAEELSKVNEQFELHTMRGLVLPDIDVDYLRLGMYFDEYDVTSGRFVSRHHQQHTQE